MSPFPYSSPSNGEQLREAGAQSPFTEPLYIITWSVLPSDLFTCTLCKMAHVRAAKQREVRALGQREEPVK